jgi:predicted nucleotidyltransferase
MTSFGVLPRPEHWRFPKLTGQTKQADLLEKDAVLAEIVRRLVETLRPERIYLFGSKGRGDSSPDSDYDLMVVVPHASEPGYRLAQKAHSLLWGLGTAADILVWTREAFDGRLHLKASLPATVVREGTLLYVA